MGLVKYFHPYRNILIQVILKENQHKKHTAKEANKSRQASVFFLFCEFFFYLFLFNEFFLYWFAHVYPLSHFSTSYVHNEPHVHHL